MPMLPPTKTGFSSARNISPRRAVVVVLPLEPVTPTIGPGQSSMNSVSMDQTGTPPRRASSSPGRSSGTPCDTNTASASLIVRGSLPPSERRTGRSATCRTRAARRLCGWGARAGCLGPRGGRGGKYLLGGGKRVVRHLKDVGAPLQDKDDPDDRQDEPLAGHESGGR